MATRCLKKNLSTLAVIILLLMSISVKAQLNPPIGTGPWKYVTPFEHGFSMLDMSFIDNKNGLAVGVNGGLAKTTDSGFTWKYIPYKFINNTNTVAIASFNDVHFVTPTVAYAVGNSGLMIKSIDGGVNWSQITTPLTALGKNINALHFLNKDTGYIGGAAINTTNTTNVNDAPKIYFTRNGGATWDSLAAPFTPSPTNITLNQNNQKEIHRIHFANDSIGYAVGSSGNDYTGGQAALLWKIHSGKVTDYSLHRTKFGLTTGSHTPSVQTFKGVLAYNDSLVFISSMNNNVFIKVQTGKNDSTASALPAIFGNYVKGKYDIKIWLASTATPFPANLASAVAGQMLHIKKTPDNTIALLIGRSIVFSKDLGESWTYTQPTPNDVLYAHWGYSSFDITPNGRIIAGSFNGLTYDSIPGGKWRTNYKNIRPLFYSYAAMDWADCNNGIAVGANGTISTTNDGGKNWKDNSNPSFDAGQISLTNVFYPAVNSMFYSTFNSIYTSPDQGTTNDVIFTEPTNGQFTSFEMNGQDRAWVTATRFSPAVERTMIYRTLNANAASPVWDTTKTFPQGNFAPQLRNIKFANKDTGYTVGSRGKVYRTVNGGDTWTDVSPDTTVNANGTATYTAIGIVTGKIVYIGGSSKKLFKTTDAGATWTDLTLESGTNPIVLSAFASVANIIMNDENNGYLHAGATLLITKDGWKTYKFDVSPQGLSNISIYPKIAGPIESKKLYGFPLIAGFGGPGSTQSAAIVSYGNESLINVSTSETKVNATCTSPNGGSITINSVGGIAPYSFKINSGTYQNSNQFTGLAAGDYIVKIKDAGCQEITKTITIGFDDNLTLATNIKDTTVCAGAPVQLNASSLATTYAWTPASGLSASDIANPIARVNSSTKYKVTATLGACVKTAEIDIFIKSNPVINAGPDKQIMIGESITLQGSGNANSVSIAWTPNTTLTGANTYTPVAKPITTTNYTLTVVDDNGCTSTDNANVVVIPYCIKVKNAFTPNGDGINDKWFVTESTDCVMQIGAKVFNRSGNLVFSSDNYNNDWNGTYKGKPVPDGTYYYVLTYRLINNKTVSLKGDVTILR